MGSSNRFARVAYLAVITVALGVISLTTRHVTVALGADAQTGPGATEPSLRLWDQDAPGAQGSADDDIPTLSPFFPDPGKATGAAFIVCPGGAYQHLSPREGPPVAQWLNSVGIAGFVLKYRLGPKYHDPVQLEDVQRAIRLVRAHASQWNLDPKRIGIIGFSAGGHLASCAATHFGDGDASGTNGSDEIERASCRPDLAILVYPVITMVGPYVHAGSRTSLLGPNPNPVREAYLSSDQQVTAQTPPCFLVHGADDRTVPVQNSLLFTSACRTNGVPVELHIFEHGPHGFALGGNDPALKTWPTLAAQWLKRHGFAN